VPLRQCRVVHGRTLGARKRRAGWHRLSPSLGSTR
jgi:hypothetical protein